jgi:hypothetical protein
MNLKATIDIIVKMMNFGKFNGKMMDLFCILYFFFIILFFLVCLFQLKTEFAEQYCNKFLKLYFLHFEAYLTVSFFSFLFFPFFFFFVVLIMDWVGAVLGMFGWLIYDGG